jgi:hypothetical protein
MAVERADFPPHLGGRGDRRGFAPRQSPRSLGTNVADLRFELGQGSVTIAAAIPPPVVSEKGGRPSDALSVIAEAGRRLNAGAHLPSSLAGFARELREWLNEQPNVVRITRERRGCRSEFCHVLS